MKRTTQMMVAVVAFLVATTSCKKNAYEYTPGPPAEKAAVSKLEKDGEVADISYNGDGSIKSILSKQSTGAVLANYVFSYEGGKLKEINYGGKWQYYYTGNLLTKIETYNTGGQLRYVYELAYTNGSLTQKTDYQVNPFSGMVPKFKTNYYYRTDGNVSKREVFQYNNNAWQKTEDILITEYDQYTNVSDRFESYPYLPAKLFSPNNPVKETWLDDIGQLSQTVEHVYTYDVNGQPKTRRTTYKFPGFPDGYSELKIEY